MLATPMVAEEESSFWSRLVSPLSLKGRQETSAHCSLVLAIDFGTTNSSVAVWREDKSRVKIIKNKREAKLTPSQLIFAPHFDHYFVGDVTDLPAEVLLYCDPSYAALSPPTAAHDNPANTDSNAQKRPLLKLDDTLIQRRVITGLKNLLGLESVAEVRESYPHFPYQLDVLPNHNRSEGEREMQLVVLCEDTLGHTRRYTVTELVSFVLLYLKQCAVDYLQRKPIKSSSNSNSHEEECVEALHRVVLGVPAHFPEKKKDALRQAAFMAGFDEVHLVVESTAAAMAYGLLVAGRKRAMVFDMGGGTTDISLLQIDETPTHTETRTQSTGREAKSSIEVLYTGGHSQLGGQDFDQRLLRLIQEKLLLALKRRGIEASLDEINSTTAKRVLLVLSKRCKEALSKDSYHEIHLSRSHFEAMCVSFANKLKECETVKLVVNRDEFVESVKPLLALVQQTVEIAIESLRKKIAPRNAHSEEDFAVEHIGSTTIAAVDTDDLLDEIVLVGGGSRMPAIHDALRAALEKHGIYTFSAKNSSNNNGNSNSSNNNSNKREREREKHVAREFCTAVSPEHAVVEGLAIKGAILSGADTHTLKSILMMDCLPAAIGLMTREREPCEDGVGEREVRVFEPVLSQGQRLPCVVSKVFQLHSPRQRFVSLEIYEEIEECVSSSSSSSSTATSSSAKNETNCERKYSYYLLTTADVPIYHSSSLSPSPLSPMSSGSGAANEFSSQPRFVELVFRVDEDARLSYEVHEIDDASLSAATRSASADVLRERDDDNDDDDAWVASERERERVRARSSSSSSGESTLLTVCIVLLVVVYIALKMVFAPDAYAHLSQESEEEDAAIISDVTVNATAFALHAFEEL